jgi:hypothetical protein
MIDGGWLTKVFGDDNYSLINMMLRPCDFDGMFNHETWG